MTPSGTQSRQDWGELRRLIRLDISRNCKPGRTAMLSGLLFNTALQVVLSYRIHHFLASRRSFKLSLIQLILANWQVSRGNCQISPRAKIGGGLLLPHPIGVVIGNGCVLGEGVTLYQHVTIGNDGRPDAYPRIGSRVTVYATSSVIGAIEVGDGAVVGAHSLLNSSIPAGAVAFGVPARQRSTNN